MTPTIKKLATQADLELFKILPEDGNYFVVLQERKGEGNREEYPVTKEVYCYYYLKLLELAFKRVKFETKTGETAKGFLIGVK